MFGRRTHRQGGGGGGFFLFLLGVEVYRFLASTNKFYPVMLSVLALNVGVHLRPDLLRWPSVHNACISASKIWLGKKWRPLFYSAFTHGSDTHLYFNMASFMWKAATLEERFGSAYFLYMTFVFTFLTGVLYVGTGVLMAELLNDWTHMQSCAVGFSGVIFALKVVTTHLQPPGRSYVMGIPIPSRLACWAELVLISVLVPNASFIGHLAGILVGLAFVWGPLKAVMDVPWQMIRSLVPVGALERGQNYHYRGHRRYNDAARTTGYAGNSEEEELQEVLRQSRDQYLRERGPFRYQQRQQDLRREVQSTGPGVQSTSHDIDEQTAIENSIRDTGVANPRPPNVPPPPVNPDFTYISETDSEDSSFSPLPSTHTHTTPYPDDNGPNGMPVPANVDTPYPDTDRMPMPSSGSGRRTAHHQGPQESSGDANAIRAARLRRFDRPH